MGSPMARTATKTKPIQPDLLGEPQQQAKTPAKRKMAGKTGTALSVVKPTAADKPKSMLELIAAAARDPSVDTGKMESLLNMQMRVMAEQARIEFNAAFDAMQAKLPKIRPDGKIEIPAKREGGKPQVTAYAKYPAILNVCRPIMREHGFTYNSMAQPGTGAAMVNIRCVLRHRGGHQEESIFPMPLETSGSKNNVQGVGSSYSYAKRYGIIGLLDIISEAPEDDDRNGQFIGFDSEQPAPQQDKISPQQKQKLAYAMDTVSLSAKKFCTGFRLQRVDDLPSAQFDEAMTRIKDYGLRK